MRLIRTILAAGACAAVLATAGTAAAAIHFTADYRVSHTANAHVEPDGTLVSTFVPETVYTGQFQFDLTSVSDTITDLGGGQRLRTIDVAFTFAPFDFAPDLQALVDAEDIPSIGPLLVNTTGFIHAVRLETADGDLIALQEMSNAFNYSEARVSFAEGDSLSLYRSIRANLSETYTDVGDGLTGSGAADIAAYLQASTQFWNIGSAVSFSGPFFAPPTVHGGINFAGLLTFENVSFVDDSVVAPPGVPEPSTWALMIGGFGAAGAVLRRRRGAYAGS